MIGQEITSFVLVLVTAVVVASVISTLYATGIRMWSGVEVAGSNGTQVSKHKAAGIVCFALCVAIVLFALWLMIPMFH